METAPGHAAGRCRHASNNVDKPVVEFAVWIPRERLRASYGLGFKGAPLACVAPDGPDRLDRGGGGGEGGEAKPRGARSVRSQSDRARLSRKRVRKDRTDSPASPPEQ